MRDVTVATTQMACDWDRDRNVARAEALVRQAAARGASIVLLQELFESPYFPKDQSARYFALAQPIEGHPLVARMSRLAAELGVVLPISFFERANNAYFNSLAMIDADGRVLGLYRKSHIPDGPGYQEKYYFNPGDTGFRDDTGLVAHNMELARASQGQSGGMFGLDDRRNIVDQSGGATDQVLGAPPAYSEGGILGGYNSVFAPNAPPSGWFTMKDYYNQSPKGQANPGANTADAQMLSTNNWRLLPAQYRDPNYFMVNGQIIDRRLAQRQLAPASVMGLEGGTGAHGFTPTRGSDPGRWRTGHNVAGFGANEGYIGSLGGWGSVGGEVT